MLTKRTNVLFTEEDYLMLSELAKGSKKTIGEIVRHAVKKTYKNKNKSNKEIIKMIKKGWTFLKNPEIPVDYKEWVEYGRKY